MKTTVLAIMTAIAVALALLTSTAFAKEPHEVRISGGDMTQEVSFPISLLTSQEAAPLLGDPIETRWVSKPHDLGEVSYHVEVWGEAEDTAFLMTALDYYPAHDGQVATMRDWQNGYVLLGTKLESVLNEHIASVAPEDDDARPLVWYIAPSLALGLVLAGSSFVGRKFLLRRNIDT